MVLRNKETRNKKHESGVTAVGQIVIEGSITPCVELSRGEQVEVEHTEHVQNLIAGGYVVVVDEQAKKSGRRSRSKSRRGESEQDADTPES